jgi:hypothetical protein
MTVSGTIRISETENGYGFVENALAGKPAGRRLPDGIEFWRG